MRTLVVAPYPPRRDGIAAYAAVHAARLRDGGDDVTVLSPPDGDGDVRAEFLGGAAFRRAAAMSDRFDRVLVHFQPSLYFRPRAPVSKVATAASLVWLCRLGRTELLVHEADPPIRWRPDYVLLGVAFRAARKVMVHTRAELASLERRYGVRVRGEVVSQAQGTQVHAISRDAARSRLGISLEETLFVVPGFIHPDKGIDRAVTAFADLGRGRLAVVGSVRDPIPANVAYASRLRAACSATTGAELREGYVSDEELDAWIAAADTIVLPYRRSWSSGMLARAQALGTPAIVSSAGGLPEQAGEADTVVDDDEALAKAMASVARERPAERSAR